MNILGLQLNPDGTVLRLGAAPGDLVGSITSGDNITFWTGHLEGHINPATFDVRLDDTHGVSYVMNGIVFGADRLADDKAVDVVVAFGVKTRNVVQHAEMVRTALLLVIKPGLV